MIHAKTSVADGIWSRVGSSNLNLASLLGNWELDLVILDREVGGEMEDLFRRDMNSSVEILLRRGVSTRGGRLLERVPVMAQPDQPNIEDLQAAREARRRAPRGSRIGRIIGRVSRAGSVLGRALVGQRMVGREDSGWIAAIAAALLGVAAVGFLAPRFLAWPISLLFFWLGIASLFRAWPRKRSD